MSSTKISALTGIRGVAAVWVVIFHSYPLAASLLGWPARSQIIVVRDGFLAVDLFFVLSGFVLSIAYAEKFRSDFRPALVAFAVARVHRILPLHWATLAVLLGLVGSFPHYWWGPGPFTPNAFALSAALLQDWDEATALAWNHPSWSLSAEWAAYILFPFLIFGVNVLKRRDLAVGGSIIALLTLVALLLHARSSSLDHVGPAGLVRCICQFSAGALAWKALSFGGWRSRMAGEVFFAAGAGLLALALAVPDCQLLAPFAFVSLVVGCALPSRSAGRLFGNSCCMILGEISFSIYLVHILVLGCVGAAADRLELSDASLTVRAMAVLAIPVLVVSTAYLTWKYIEMPSQALARSFKSADRPHIADLTHR